MCQHVFYQHLLQIHTLLVILGLLAASVVWTKKTKVIERINKSEMTAFWKEAMVPDGGLEGNRGIGKGYIV